MAPWKRTQTGAELEEELLLICVNVEWMRWMRWVGGWVGGLSYPLDVELVVAVEGGEEEGGHFERGRGGGGGEGAEEGGGGGDGQ